MAVLLLALAPFPGSASAETAQDGFGSAVAAYRAGGHGKALEGWRALADDGNALAQYNVGLLHYQGHGTPRSYAQALIWFHAAARQGLAASYLRLGAMFEHGEGVPRDFEQAYLWYTLAVSAFGPGPCRDKALDRRRLVAKNLTEAQVLKVLAESSEWAPGPLGGVGQPCFKSIAVRPVDGPDDASSAAVQGAKTAAAAEPPTDVQASKKVVAAQKVKTAADRAATDVRETGGPSTVAPVLMSKLPAKMPGSKDHSKVPGVASSAPQEEADAKPAEPLPTVEVAKRKVHTVKPPGRGKVPLVGTTARETAPAKERAMARAPVAGSARREIPASATSSMPVARETVMPRPTTPTMSEASGAMSAQGNAAGAAKKQRMARRTPSASRRATASGASREMSGVYVQLGALSTRKMADEVWSRLRARNSDIFGGRHRKIERIHAKGGKILYRLYAGPFVNDGKADAFCDTLKRRDEACFVPPKFRHRR